jgi:hypothetical protein
MARQPRIRNKSIPDTRSPSIWVNHFLLSFNYYDCYINHNNHERWRRWWWRWRDHNYSTKYNNYFTNYHVNHYNHNYNHIINHYNH